MKTIREDYDTKFEEVKSRSGKSDLHISLLNSENETINT
jgi:hypothetical protein